jgi:hypothetical protein
VFLSIKSTNCLCNNALTRLQQYAASPAANWLHKDAAVFLVISLVKLNVNGLGSRVDHMPLWLI